MQVQIKLQLRIELQMKLQAEESIADAYIWMLNPNASWTAKFRLPSLFLVKQQLGNNAIKFLWHFELLRIEVTLLLVNNVNI